MKTETTHIKSKCYCNRIVVNNFIYVINMAINALANTIPGLYITPKGS